MNPSFYNPANAASWGYRPDQRAVFLAAQEASRARKIRPHNTDRKKVHLLMIDVQKDFCFPEGTLYVGGRYGTGAIDDSRRLAEFIYRELPNITETTATFDTHFSHQIFFPSFWVEATTGLAPAPHTEITTDQIRKGQFAPHPAMAWLFEGLNGNYSWLQKQVLYYCEQLEKAGKYKLYLWPEHCILGSDGHALVGVVHEARMFHSYARHAWSNAEVKGGNPLTENYSVLSPEVTTTWQGNPLAQKNPKFVRTLITADRVVIAGQAASHCVASSADDLLNEINAQDPELAKKVYVVTDLMSAVTVPDGKGGFYLDCTSKAEDAFARWEKAGMKLVKSTTPMADWPGMDL